eukprot:gene10412-13987_t
MNLTFISSAHGCERRSQRYISQQEFTAAVKYGKKEATCKDPKTGRPRWKYIFGPIVCITDETSSTEVTSWSSELPLTIATIPIAKEIQYQQMMSRLRKNPDIITSHHVMIVDKSGSMRKADINGHKSRYRSAYYTLAQDFVFTQLCDVNSKVFSANTIDYTDVVTLIEMRDNPTIIFEREPISWQLYNKLVVQQRIDDARSHGNYLPSIQEAIKCLNVTNHENCSLALLLLSDGRPSDPKYSNDVIQLINSVSMKYKSRIWIQTFGYGNSNNLDFKLLKDMSVNAMRNGAMSEFQHGSANFGTALDSIILHSSINRSLLSQLNIKLAIPTSTVKITPYNPTEQFNLDSGDWNVFNRKCQRIGLNYIENNYGKFTRQEINLGLMNDDAVGFAVRKLPFGEGGERLAFEMHEINDKKQRVGAPMVAKQFIHKSSGKGQYVQSMATQMRAAKWARIFNYEMKKTNLSENIPRIQYNPC